MSHQTFNEIWSSTMKRLTNNIDKDPLPVIWDQNSEDVEPEPELEDADEVFEQKSNLYIQYVLLYKSLEDAYDQMAQPQKRIEIKKCLEAIMGRILEIRDVLVRLQQRECVQIGELSSDLKLTFSDLDIPIPRFVVDERQKELEERNKLLNALITQYSLNKDAEEPKTTSEIDNKAKEVVNLSLEEAILIIQRNERGRQGRLKARDSTKNKNDSNVVQNNVPASKVDQVKAATTIQKVFLGHLARKKTKEMRKEELAFLAMDLKEKIIPGSSNGNNTESITSRNMNNRGKTAVDPMEHAEQNRVRRKLIQLQNMQEYLQAIVSIKQKMLEQEGPEMKEQMAEEIRRWFISHKQQTGKFPAFPSAAQGGSAKIVPQKTEEAAKSEPQPPAKASKESGAVQSPISRSTTAISSPGNESKKPNTGASNLSFISTKKKNKEEPKEMILVPDSKFVSAIHIALEEYQKTWKERDESNNFAQKYDADIIKQGARPEIEKQIRQEVDVQLRAELEKLRKTLDGKKKSRKGKKGKKSKEPSGEVPAVESAPEPGDEGKSSKGKKTKGKKGKKDPLGGRSIESLYGELVSKSIIVKCPTVKMSDFIADHIYAFAKPLPKKQEDEEQKESTLDHSLADIKNAIIECCTFPLASPFVHTNAPLYRTILLYGASGTGKTMLTHAVATETGAVFMEISPARIVSALNSSNGTNMDLKQLMLIVFTVAKAMAPTVMFIDELDTVFARDKKKSKDTQEGPEVSANALKNFKKIVFKSVRSIKAGDRILVICNSKAPQRGKVPLIKFCNKILYLPLPNYSSRFILWKSFISSHSYSKITDSLDISSLAKVSEGYSAGAIYETVKETLDVLVAKKTNLENEPLVASQFIEALSKRDPIKTEEIQAFEAFQGKVEIKKLPDADEVKKMVQSKKDQKKGKKK